MKINYFRDNLIAAISNRKDGLMRLTGLEEFDAPTRARRIVFLKSLEINPKNFVAAESIHNSKVEVVSAPGQENVILKETDALITGEKGVFLGITNADCFSLYFYNPILEVIGLAHCGWRGILAGVIENTIIKMRHQFGVKSEDVIAFIGPGIRECHFEVGADVAAKFPGFAAEYKIQTPIIPPPNSEYPSVDTQEIKKIYRVDLEAAIIERLTQMGVSRENIEALRHCTFCHKAITELKALPEKSVFEYQYFSWRRDQSVPLKTQMAIFGMIKK